MPADARDARVVGVPAQVAIARGIMQSGRRPPQRGHEVIADECGMAHGLADERPRAVLAPQPILVAREGRKGSGPVGVDTTRAPTGAVARASTPAGFA